MKKGVIFFVMIISMAIKAAAFDDSLAAVDSVVSNTIKPEPPKISSLTLSIPLKKPLKTYDQEKQELIDKVSTAAEPRKFVIAFDVHGVLTNCHNPSYGTTNEEAIPENVALYHQLQSLGATVVITSAWNEFNIVAQSLRKAGIDIQERERETFYFDQSVTRGTQTQSSRYEIYMLDNIVGARTYIEQEIPNHFYKNKALAAVYYAKTHGVTGENVNFILIDDSSDNIRSFSFDTTDNFPEFINPRFQGIRY